MLISVRKDVVVQKELPCDCDIFGHIRTDILMCSQSMVPQTVLFWLLLEVSAHGAFLFGAWNRGRHGKEEAKAIENWQIDDVVVIKKKEKGRSGSNDSSGSCVCCLLFVC